MTSAIRDYADQVQAEQEAFYRASDAAFDAHVTGSPVPGTVPEPGTAPDPANTAPEPSGPSQNALDMLAALWSTSALNPDVKRRQERSEKKTEFMIEHHPGYATEYARLLEWISTYEVPIKRDDQ